MSRFRRRNKLPKPSLQLRLVGSFLGISALSLLLQLLVVGLRVTELAVDLPVGGDALADRLPSALLKILGYSFAVVLPATMGIGILLTFRTAGPIYHFEKYLAQVARGEQEGPCRLREADELQELCRLINEALAAEREAGRREAEQERAEPERPRLHRAG